MSDDNNRSIRSLWCATSSLIAFSVLLGVAFITMQFVGFFVITPHIADQRANDAIDKLNLSAPLTPTSLLTSESISVSGSMLSILSTRRAAPPAPTSVLAVSSVETAADPTISVADEMTVVITGSSGNNSMWSLQSILVDSVPIAHFTTIGVSSSDDEELVPVANRIAAHPHAARRHRRAGGGAGGALDIHRALNNHLQARSRGRDSSYSGHAPVPRVAPKCGEYTVSKKYQGAISFLGKAPNAYIGFGTNLPDWPFDFNGAAKFRGDVRLCGGSLNVSTGDVFIGQGSLNVSTGDVFIENGSLYIGGQQVYAGASLVECSDADYAACGVPSSSCERRACIELVHDSSRLCLLAPPAEVGTACDDNDASTVNDACAAGGICRGVASHQPLVECTSSEQLSLCPASSAPSNCQRLSLCVLRAPGSAACLYEPNPDAVDESCDDHNPLTVDDRCSADGQCRGTPACATCSAAEQAACSALNSDDSCLSFVCAKFGCSDSPVCLSTPRANGDACASSGTCSAGVCIVPTQPPPPPSIRLCTPGEQMSFCDEPADCRRTRCLVFVDSQNSAIDAVCSDEADGTLDGTPCDDGLESTRADRCYEGVCRGLVGVLAPSATINKCATATLDMSATNGVACSSAAGCLEGCDCVCSASDNDDFLVEQCTVVANVGVSCDSGGSPLCVCRSLFDELLTRRPTVSPTVSPTRLPTVSPTVSPTRLPTVSPTVSPTLSPTVSPTLSPTVSPTLSPTVSPTVSPSASPTRVPSASPTVSPTVSPSASPTRVPSASPTVSPSGSPTRLPSASPSGSPTRLPSASPSASPTRLPTASPTLPAPRICSFDFSSSNGSEAGVTATGGFVYGAYTGATQNGWSTNLAGFYTDGMSAYLTFPAFTYESSDEFVTVYFSRFDTESCCDFLSVQVQTNITSGSFVALTPYYISVLPASAGAPVNNTFNPAISGGSNLITSASVAFKYPASIPTGTPIRVRVLFGSDGSVVQTGVGIQSVYVCGQSPLFAPTLQPSVSPTRSPSTTAFPTKSPTVSPSPSPTSTPTGCVVALTLTDSYGDGWNGAIISINGTLIGSLFNSGYTYNHPLFSLPLGSTTPIVKIAAGSWPTEVGFIVRKDSYSGTVLYTLAASGLFFSTAINGQIVALTCSANGVLSVGQATNSPTASPTRNPTASPSTTSFPTKSPTTSPTPSPTRTRVVCLGTPVQIESGGAHACVLSSEGEVMCWGSNYDGQLGNWPSQNDFGDNEPVSAAEPVQLPPGTKATHVCTGLSHTCALLNDSSVACWGYNGNGQLGNSNTNVNINPFVSGPPPRVTVTSNPSLSVTQVACGQSHTCALLSNGDISCWGANFNGQLGRGTITSVLNPGLFPPTHVTTNASVSVVKLSLGSYHSCALLSNGYVTCWGYNQYGQLGVLNSTSLNNASSVVPIQLLNSTAYTAVQIDAGDSHTCALLSDWSVHCWGLGSSGQLGYSSTVNVADSVLRQFRGPVAITTNASIHVVQLSAGYGHTCARFNDGSLKCWGDNLGGALGVTTSVSNIGISPSTAVINYGPVATGATRANAALDLCTGFYYTCSIFNTEPTRDLVCWGSGFNGRLGTGNTTSQDNVTALPSIPACTDTYTAQPTAYPTLSPTRSPSTTAFPTKSPTVSPSPSPTRTPTECVVALTLTDSYGDGWNGAIISINGTLIGSAFNTGTVYNHPLFSLPLGSTTPIVKIAAGNFPTEVGFIVSQDSYSGPIRYTLAENGLFVSTAINGPLVALTCSANGVLSVGVATQSPTASPTQSTTASPTLSPALSSTLSPTLSPTPSPTRTRVGCLGTPVQIESGGSHACVLSSEGEVMCWGSNFYGQLGNWPTGQNLGDNELVSTAEPVQLPLDRKATQVCAGLSHTCALLNDSSVVCWGQNAFGQLGNQNTGVDINPFVSGPPQPVTVTSNSTLSVTQVDCGWYHTCVVLSSGDISCWGQNNNGQLGRNGIVNVYTPEAFPPTHVTSNSAVSVVKLSLGSYHSCALLSDGTVTCWGWGSSGRLGTLSITSLNNATNVVPIQLLNGIAYTAVQIQAGGSHTCALLNDSSVHCWGLGVSGRLGYSSTANVADSIFRPFRGPVAITTNTSIHVVQLSAGSVHTCARFNDGSLKCWGSNLNGLLGISTSTTSVGSSVGTAVVNYPQIDTGTARAHVAIDLSSGDSFTCSLFNTEPTRDVVCWGLGSEGQLGTGNTTSQFNVSALASIPACNDTYTPQPTASP